MHAEFFMCMNLILHISETEQVAIAFLSAIYLTAPGLVSAFRCNPTPVQCVCIFIATQCAE